MQQKVFESKKMETDKKMKNKAMRMVHNMMKWFTKIALCWILMWTMAAVFLNVDITDVDTTILDDVVGHIKESPTEIVMQTVATMVTLFTTSIIISL
jgi:hypothetical protein